MPAAVCERCGCHHETSLTSALNSGLPHAICRARGGSGGVHRVALVARDNLAARLERRPRAAHGRVVLLVLAAVDS